MKVVEEVTVIGATVLCGELLEVSGRAGDLEALWVRRAWPEPCREYGSVRFPLSQHPRHSASMWTSDWSTQMRGELGGRAAAVYAEWIAAGCPDRSPPSKPEPDAYSPDWSRR
ncbi:hypothetical protein AB0I28_19750 [Phytomonospora sp. NPDC050363]|uniref:hypothetical protein n=1 Tax=Phytomonospora sp. NPDC050363 TaxID=3155642 RepID=UPI0033FBD2BD